MPSGAPTRSSCTKGASITIPGIGETAVVGVEHPDFGEAGFFLAILHGQEGRFEAARHDLDRIAHIDSLRQRVVDFKHMLDVNEQKARQAGLQGR